MRKEPDFSLILLYPLAEVMEIGSFEHRNNEIPKKSDQKIDIIMFKFIILHKSSAQHIRKLIQAKKKIFIFNLNLSKYQLN